MTKKKSAKKVAAKRATVAPATINITQHIDARGVELSVPKLQEILAKAADRARAGIAQRLSGETIAGEIVTMPAERFTKVSKDGKALPASATEWEGVYDAELGLIVGRALLPDAANWKDSMKKARDATMCGAPARAPTIQERLAITDFTKHSPALDPRFFAKESGWEWTSTPDAESPSDCAWGVGLGSGGAYRYNQDAHYHVRAVRAGQPLGL